MNFSQNIFKLVLNFFSKLGFFSNVKLYSGNFKNGLFHGKGRLEFKDGSVYEGEFENNEMNGYGKIFFKDGSIYQGNFKNNLRHGTGLSKSIDGITQRIVYQNGKFKETYKENFTVLWENKIEGSFDIRAEPNKVMEIFKSLTINDVLRSSDITSKDNGVKVKDIIFYR